MSVLAFSRQRYSMRRHVDVVERGGKVGNFATRHVPELNCERVTDRLCKAILRF
jgi:hypothetical protein